MNERDLREIYDALRPGAADPSSERWVDVEHREGIAPSRAWTEATRSALQIGVAPQVLFATAAPGAGLSTALGVLAQDLADQGRKVLRGTLAIRRTSPADELDLALASILAAGRGVRDPAEVAGPPREVARRAADRVAGAVVIVDTSPPPATVGLEGITNGLCGWIDRMIAEPLPVHLVCALPVEVAPWATWRLPLTVLPSLPVVGVESSVRHASFGALRAVLRARAGEGRLAELLPANQLLRVLEASAGNLGELLDLVRMIVAQTAFEAATAVDRCLARRAAALRTFARGEAAGALRAVKDGGGLDAASASSQRLLPILLRSGLVQPYAGDTTWWGVHPLVEPIA